MASQQINVLFIGLTQMGKSSLLKSILRYGGNDSNADKVVVGSGNESQTQEVTPYIVNIRIKDHFLQHEESGKRIEADEDTDPADYYNVSEPTDHTVELNVIDTPGMSDSGGCRGWTRSSAKTDNDRDMTTNIADELHKMRILLHLQKLEVIHAVVIVAKYAQPFSESFQHMANDYFALFDASSLQPEWHVAHTGVPHLAVLAGSVVQRETQFLELLSRKAKHHYLENYPSKYNSIAQYCSRANLKSFLTSLSASQPAKIGSLCYLKSDTALTSEMALRETYDLINNTQYAKSSSSELRKIETSGSLVRIHGNEKLLPYLAAGNILCLARYHGLNLTCRLSELSTDLTPTTEDAERLAEEQMRHERLLRMRHHVLNTLEVYRTQKEHFGFEQGFDDSWRSELNKTKKAKCDVEELLVRIGNVPTTTESLAAAMKKSTLRTTNCVQSLRQWIEAQEAAIWQESELFATIFRGTEMLLDDSKHLKAKWTTSQAFNETAIEAIKETQLLSSRSELPVGHLTVLQRAPMMGERHRYMSLYDEVALLKTAEQFKFIDG